jgi:integrator complex subunit 11
VPVYYSAGLAARANDYYRQYVNWTNQKIKEAFVERNMFDFEHIKPFESAFANNPGMEIVHFMLLVVLFFVCFNCVLCCCCFCLF